MLKQINITQVFGIILISYGKVFKVAFILTVCYLSLDTTSASDLSQVFSSDDSKPGEDVKPVIQSPKSSLNLAGLKAAFSSQRSSNSQSKSGLANSGPTQKTLQLFFKGSVKPPTSTASVKCPLKPIRDLATCPPVGKSVLDGFRYGKTSGDTDNEKDSAASSCDLNASDSYCSGLELSSHEPTVSSPSVENETFEETSDNSHTLPEDSELKPEPITYTEDETISPNAKRARKENPNFSTKDKPKTFSNSSEEPFSLVVDAPVCLQRRKVLLQFSLQELAEKMRQLHDQHKERESGKLCYRRFRAKINPGENQSAEEELKKEIR